MRPEQPAKSYRASGFTLVELLVLIGIIAVLLAMLLPALNKVRRQALCVRCQSNLRQLLLASQMYANDNNGVMPGYDSTASIGGSNNWWLTLAKYVAPPDFNPSDVNHNQVQVYNCPACDQNLIQATLWYPIFWDQFPVTYAISVFASDSNPNATNWHNGTYQYTKSNQWFASNFILFADAFPWDLPLPGGNYGGGGVFGFPNQLNFDLEAAFYHGSGDCIYTEGNSPMRTNAGFLDEHVESLSAEAFCLNYLSPENVLRCPLGKPLLNSGRLYIPLLPPYGSGKLYPYGGF